MITNLSHMSYSYSQQINCKIRNAHNPLTLINNKKNVNADDCNAEINWSAEATSWANIRVKSRVSGSSPFWISYIPILCCNSLLWWIFDFFLRKAIAKEIGVFKELADLNIICKKTFLLSRQNYNPKFARRV